MFKSLLAAGMVFTLLAETSPLSAANNPRFDPKGNDIDALAFQDSLGHAIAVERESARIEKRRAFAEALRLNEPESDCIAKLSRSGKCLLDVREFNRFADASAPAQDTASQNQSPGSAPRWDVDSARTRLASIILQDAFAEYQFDNEEKKDSLKTEIDRAQAVRIEGVRKGMGDSTLRRLYRHYQAEFFNAKEAREYRVLGTSDSAFADSLAKACPAALKAGASRACDSLPWSRIREKDIPLPAQAALKALKAFQAGETSRPIKTRFGFFLFRLESIRQVPGMPYEQAVPLLGGLYSLPRGTEPRNEAAMAAYYQENRESFLAPDTVELQAWLRPPFKRKVGEFAKDIEKKIRLQLPVPDTMNAGSIRIPLDSLPDEVGKRLAGRRHLERGRFFGPFNSTWGTWYFKVAENRPGSSPLPFEAVRNKILAILFPGLGTDPFITAQSISKAKLNDIRNNMLSEYHAKTEGTGKRNEDFQTWLQREVAMQYIRP